LTRSGSGAHRAAAGDEQHPHGFAIAAAARLGEMITGERLAGGADRVELVRLRAIAARRACWALDLDDPFAVREQERRQPRAVAAARLDRPHATPCGVQLGEPQLSLVTERVSRHRSILDHDASQRRDDCSRVRIAMRVHADDVICLLCEDTHARTSR
jgi:hypothetical protein